MTFSNSTTYVFNIGAITASYMVGSVPVINTKTMAHEPSKEYLEAQEVLKLVGLPSYPSPEQFVAFLKDHERVEKAWRALELKEMW